MQERISVEFLVLLVSVWYRRFEKMPRPDLMLGWCQKLSGVIMHETCSFYAPEGWHIVIDSSVRLSVHPSLFCPEHNFKTMQGIYIKLHSQIDLIEEKCSAQKPYLKAFYFWSYCLCSYSFLNFVWSITQKVYKLLT